MARMNVSPVTQSTINDMIQASHEMAQTLGMIRNQFAMFDEGRELGRRTESIRVKFAGFASAAEAGRVTDPVTLESLAGVYDGVAGAVCELVDAGSSAEASNALSTALGLTLLCSALVASGPAPVFAA